ncbi:iron permease FTR1 family-domain-containing protein [Chaetomium strumarium]|uniref:Iron permease FTR1 family-domain-containing protein n=1 Tax=Chaetomium strumarium TaxID=1170767 RepID=A0AAJ0GYF3_9PEZI|nr:iron permease FTR1 family-domain-containing protein [Chaetomium strumarium]
MNGREGTSICMWNEESAILTLDGRGQPSADGECRIEIPNVFSLPIFLVTFREALETVIIVSVQLTFLMQTMSHDKALHKRLVRQVWLGTTLGLFLTLLIAAALIVVFYTAGASKWEASELRFEGAFSLVACVIISVVGAALLRVGRMRDEWWEKLRVVMEKRDMGGSGDGGDAGVVVRVKGRGRVTRVGVAVQRWMERYAMFALPFMTVLREGIEAVVFIAGVTFSAPATAVPLAVVVGLAAGAAVGFAFYKGGSTTKLQLFLVISTCLLYLVAAGLFSRAVWAFEQDAWQTLIGSDAAELGEGLGSYDIDKSVWHVNCCSPTYNGGSGWGFFNASFGWTNSATYGSVISCNLYWLCVIVSFLVMRYREVKGHWPLVKSKGSQVSENTLWAEDQSSGKSASRREELSGSKTVARDEITVAGV